MERRTDINGLEAVTTRTITITNTFSLSGLSRSHGSRVLRRRGRHKQIPGHVRLQRLEPDSLGYGDG